ncbi:putative ankyrin repeat-containing domain, PGG domain, ankyrin repeat-containing domain superfamily [Helianthus annuus]|nr:putative ankyrin repeat-containing domain, PGG domain, ankyrin repeat-containing domain superfamily [Helianthus annuus]KAJ0651279.1 putative ankyrin repeat-containing domain, PGG domain, ankyrin repeat-containing domain superfamily [Helianthus annuus]
MVIFQVSCTWFLILLLLSDFTVIHVAEQESLATRLLKAIWHSTVRMTKAEVDSILRGPHDEEPQDGQQATTSDVRPRKYSSRLLFIAAEMGNIKFIVELIRSYPDLIWQVNDNNQSIFHVAVSHRQEGVYNLLYEIGMTDLIAPLTDVDGNNMLHLAAMNPKNKRLQEISGVALQMQRELLWYKEVEGMIPPSYQERKNNAGLLPHELFTKEHKELMSASEKWMKDTASHCMVVAALIATIVFAAAFTVPGGYNQDKGIPIFRQRKAFIIFVISDAISLTFATVSILMFLYILTSRYAEQDFLETLPKKLMKGLATLFLSIVAMMVAFSASFFVLYHNELIWVPKVITLFASTPVILYGRHQYALLADVYRSTYGSKYLFKPKKHMLY